LWLIVIGRKEYRYPLVVPDALREAVASPNAQGRHPLMEIALAHAVGSVSDRHEAFARYYFHALPKFGLGPFVSRAEIISTQRFASFEELAHLADTLDSKGIDVPTSTTDLLGQLTRLNAAKSSAVLPGVSIVGFHRSVLGIGEDARSLFDCLLDAGIKPELVDASPRSLERFEGAQAYTAFESPRPNASVVIFCMPIFEMMRIVCTSGLIPPRRGQYWIGYWPWETTELYCGWLKAFELVDEVWASSTFLYETYSRQTEKPVTHMPLSVYVPALAEPNDVGSLFGSRFTFLCVFDFHSRIERKNPLGAISAFRAAFPGDTHDVQLILKSINGDSRPDDLNAICAAMDGDDRILLIDGPLTREEICWLIHSSNAYLSLHRSEGFGRPIAEAMLLGTPVIATGWSGSADFLNEETGFPIRYRLRPVSPTEYPFAAGQWAEPDIEHAAKVIRRLYQRGGASRTAEKAKQLIAKSYSRSDISRKLIDRLVVIGQCIAFESSYADRIPEGNPPSDIPPSARPMRPCHSSDARDSQDWGRGQIVGDR
jgi:hypothetical protein